MQEITLTIPSRKFALLPQIKNFLKNRKIRNEKNYREKIDFLKFESYKFYLEKILKKNEENNIVDLPAFMYRRGLVINKEAAVRADYIVGIYVFCFGKKFIEKCYRKCVKNLKK